MTWITEHAEHLAAIVGGVYVVVRTVVYLTPTERDDELLARARPLLAGIAKLFGLDPRQGRSVPGSKQDSA